MSPEGRIVTDRNSEYKYTLSPDVGAMLGIGRY